MFRDTIFPLILVLLVIGAAVYSYWGTQGLSALFVISVIILGGMALSEPGPPPYFSSNDMRAMGDMKAGIGYAPMNMPGEAQIIFQS